MINQYPARMYALVAVTLLAGAGFALVKPANPTLPPPRFPYIR